MRVLVTDPIADAGIERLRAAGHEVVTAYDAAGTALLDAVADADGLIVRSGTDVTEELFAAAPKLQIVGRAGIGVDNIDIDAATDHGVIVANAPEGNVRAAAEHTVGMTFATARSIPQAHGRMVDGAWAKGEFLGTELNGKTLGIVGLGRVGQEAAKRLGSLGMELVAYDPYISEERADQIGAELVELDACIDRADFLTVHVPLTDETEGLIGAEELARMREDAILVNVARGGVVDQAALVDALQADALAGAALDVFETEPLPADSPLWEMDDVIVTPHSAAAHREYPDRMAALVRENLRRIADGEGLANAVV